jgi:predicted nuclease of predicted toxin-antitoxin system
VKILIDECLPKDLAKMLTGHTAKTVVQMRWSGIKNGELLRRASKANFEVFITVDKNIPAQQPTKIYPLAIIVLHARSNRIEDIKPFAAPITDLLEKDPAPKVYTLRPGL